MSQPLSLASTLHTICPHTPGTAIHNTRLRAFGSKRAPPW